MANELYRKYMLGCLAQLELNSVYGFDMVPNLSSDACKRLYRLMNEGRKARNTLLSQKMI